MSGVIDDEARMTNEVVDQSKRTSVNEHGVADLRI